MYYVYIIASISFPEKMYVDYTLNINARLKKHNEGGSIYTRDYKPWKVAFYCCFFDKSKALAFEKYLKSHSGRAFIQKRVA